MTEQANPHPGVTEILRDRAWPRYLGLDPVAFFTNSKIEPLDLSYNSQAMFQFTILKISKIIFIRSLYRAFRHVDI